jgi:hypothetical protein
MENVLWLNPFILIVQGIYICFESRGRITRWREYVAPKKRQFLCCTEASMPFNRLAKTPGL